MIWLLLAFLSAALLGFYDVFKKQSLKENAVIPVLLLNTLFSSIIFLPFIFLSHAGKIDASSMYYCTDWTWYEQKFIVVKAFIVLSSWLFAYFGLKHLPLTIVGPINATRPVMVLVGALTFFGEHLNAWQWAGVIVAIVSFFLLSRAGKKEGLDFKHNKWIIFVVLGNIIGACSGLYDKFLMASPENGGVGLNKLAVQSWYNIYQFFMMLVVLLTLWLPAYRKTQQEKLLPSTGRSGGVSSFHWHWTIPLISIFLSAADFVYFYALGIDGAMISVVSMVRRGSVVVSFLCGAMFFHEKNLKRKFLDLMLVLLSMLLLYIGAN